MEFERWAGEVKRGVKESVEQANPTRKRDRYSFTTKCKIYVDYID